MKEEIKKFNDFKNEVYSMFARYEKSLIEPTTQKQKQTGKSDSEVPDELIKHLELKQQGISLVKHLISCGVVEMDDLYKKQWGQNIKNYQKIIIENNSSREAVNKCIDRIVKKQEQGENIKKMGAYIQTSLTHLKKDD